MRKPPPQRVASDGCAVISGGQTYYPHDGEWVELFVGITVGQLHQLRVLQEVGPRLLAAQGEQDEQVQMIRLMDDTFADVAKFLAPRVVAWSWTDDLGQPLPAPDRTAWPLMALRAEELWWLLSAAQGETAQARKKGTKHSRTTS